MKRKALKISAVSFVLLCIAGIFSTQAQVITKISPKVAAPGSDIRIYGHDFDVNANNNQLTFTASGSNYTANAVSGNTNYLIVTVPDEMIGYARVSVRRSSDGGTAQYADIFTGIERSGSSFTPVNPNIIGVRNGDAEWGDFDNDGDPDVIISGENSSGDPTVSIYRNNGTGSFSYYGSIEDVLYSVLKFGDYDNDGDLDLFLSGRNSNGAKVTNIYRNDSGVFSSIGAGLNIVDRADADWGDYDNDGDLDLVVIGTDNSDQPATWLYRNEGNGTFTALNTFINVKWGSVSWGDYDRDGDLDLVLTGRNESDQPIAVIYRNDGNGSFTDIGASDLVGVVSSSADWGDFDNDGDLDLVITGRPENSRITNIYRNNNGSFTNIEAGIEHVRDGDAVWGDYDGDGDLDLAVTGYGSNTPSFTGIYRNDGSGSFSNISDRFDPTGLGDSMADWIDYNNDGYLDLMVAGRAGSDDYRTIIYENNGPVSQYSITSIFPQSAAPGNNINIYGYGFDDQPSNNTVTFTTTGGTEYSGTIANGNENWLLVSVPTFITGNATISVRRNSDAASVTAPGIFTALSAAGDIVFESRAGGISQLQRSTMDIGDFDADGDQDVVIMGLDDSGTKRTRVFANDGTGTFTQTDELVGLNNGSVKWGDMDNDGDLDLVLTGSNNQGTGQTLIFENVNSGGFVSNQSLSGVLLSSADWVDYDADGDLDLVITGSETTRLYKNDGIGSFTVDSDNSIIGITSGSTDWADYDRDGDLDLLITGRSSSGDPAIYIYRNDGQGNLQAIDYGMTAVEAGDAAWGDYNNDGYPDIALTGRNANNDPVTVVYRNNSATSFSTVGSFDHVMESSLDWGDYDADGDLDLVIAGYNNSERVTTIYRNDGSDTFTQLDASITGVDYGDVRWANLDGDADLDLLVTGRDEANNAPFTIWYENVESGSSGGGGGSTETFFGFEDGTIPSEWTNPAPGYNYGWEISSQYSYDGTYSIRNNMVGDNQTAALEMNVSLDTDGTLSFAYKVSSEQATTFYDGLIVRIDEDDTLRKYGEIEWTTKTVELGAGEHTIRWIFERDGSAGDGENAAWIDNISITESGSGGGSTTDHLYYVESSVNPLVYTSSTLAIDFNKAVDPNSVNSNSVSIQSSLSSNMAYSTSSVENSGQTVRIYPNEYFVTTEELTLRISGDPENGLLDVNGNALDGDGDGTLEGSPEDDLVLTYTCTYVSDLTMDGNVNFDDIVALRDAWEPPQNLFYDIGPATMPLDEPPVFYPSFDGVIDFEDLMVFALDWNWYMENSSNKLQFEPLARSTTKSKTVDQPWVEIVPVTGNSYDVYLNEPDTSVAFEILLDLSSTGWAGVAIEEGALYQQKNGNNGLLLDTYRPDQQKLLLQGINFGQARYNGRLHVATIQVDGMEQSFMSSQPIKYQANVVSAADKKYSQAHQVELPKIEKELPQQTALLGNYPNPFNPSTVIQYQLAEQSRVQLDIYDVLGRNVATLINTVQQAGQYDMQWEAAKSLNSGLYFYRLTVTNEQTGQTSRHTKKMLLVK